MKYIQFRLLFIFIVCSEICAQEKDSVTVALQPVVVTALRMPMNALYINRSMNIIDRETIQNSGTACVEELLQKESNISVQPRGIFGIQSDASIRGTSFGQQLILLNGVRLNDPQTAHHNFDLPIPMEQIERIEVLKGPGSALYGPDAYGGVINIITRTPERQALILKLSGGENGLLHTSGCYDFSYSDIHSSNVIEHRRSDGYRWDTDFQVASIASNTMVELPFGRCSVLGGYTNKEFGAYNFYGPSPSKEWTETTFINAATEFSLSSSLFQPKVSYRRHYDKFMYDLRTPDTFVNIHTTNSYNGEISSITKLWESCSLITGIEGNIDGISSSNLGDYRRSSVGVLLIVHGVIQNDIITDIGSREDFHSEYGQQFNPTASIGYLFSQSGKIFFTIGRSFRAPSYTELYYSSRTRIGNSSLHPEIGWSYELGAEYYLSPQVHISSSLYQRTQRNLIDYVQFTATDTAYKATNFATATTRGIDMTFQWTHDSNPEHESKRHSLLQRVSFGYTYLDSKINIGDIYNTLYSFTHPRHQLNIGFSGKLPFEISWIASATYKIKLDGIRYTLIDAKLDRSFPHINVFLQGTNLLNQSYEEIANVPLPGRWLWGGVELKVF